MAGKTNQKKVSEENLFDRADRVYSYGGAEGKCYVQAFARELARVDEMMKERREHNKKTDRIEKLANKTTTSQDTKKSCTLFYQGDCTPASILTRTLVGTHVALPS